MNVLSALVKRNLKVFFNDKGLFFPSLITPFILIVLDIVFLSRVYRASLSAALGSDVSISLINGCIGGQLVASILSVCCITVAFCANTLMVQDKARGTIKDLNMAPTKPLTISLGYFVASVIATLIVCYMAAILCFSYLATVGWFLSFGDVILILLDILVLSIAGVAVSSLVNAFLTKEIHITAVGTIVSAGYGFIAGAYMPIATFGGFLRNLLGFLPATYGTSILRNHCQRGVFSELSEVGFSEEVVGMIKDSIDCNIYLFGQKVAMPVMYIVFFIGVIVSIGGCVAISIYRKKK